MRRLALALLLCLAAPVAAETRVPESRAEISLSFAPLVREAAPAVVNIYARRITQSRRSPFADDPFFGRFFEDFGMTEPRVQNSLGSGVILSPDGIVVSNYHVVGMATEISVVLTDRREYAARVLLGDEASDLAILELEDASDLPSLPLRDSDTVEVGELVLAIGNPFGVGQTVSSGIVSGLARSGGAGGRGQGYFLQTDAPINPGNSGGALIDMQGNLIGINTQIVTRSGGSNGIGFAIPANLVARFVEQARAGADRFERPWAGMAGQPVDADMAQALGLSLPRGLVISALHPASAFAEAGFAPGDIITEVDAQPVNSPAEMVFRMAVAGLGNRVAVTRLRDGSEDIVPVLLEPAPDDPPREETALSRRAGLPGLRLARVNPAVIAEFNLPLEATGLIVTDANRYGRLLRRGDVILGINGIAVSAPRDAEEILRRADRVVEFDILRGNRRTVVRARL